MKDQKSARLLLPALVLLAACGASESTDPATEMSRADGATLPRPTAPATTPPGATVALPGTTLLRTPTRDDALLVSITPAVVTEPCPDSPGGPDGTDAMRTELARLEPMLGAALAYGSAHSEEFGSYGLVWHGTNDASVFVSFTSHLDLHRAALTDSVSHPEELIVCQVAVTSGVAHALVAKLTDELHGRFQSIGIALGGVEVVLRPGEQEELADQLVATYGEAVEVTVCADGESCTLTVTTM